MLGRCIAAEQAITPIISRCHQVCEPLRFSHLLILLQCVDGKVDYWNPVARNQLNMSWCFPNDRLSFWKPCSKSVFQESNGIIDRISPEEDSRQFAERWKDYKCSSLSPSLLCVRIEKLHHSVPHRVPRAIESGLHYNVCTNFEIGMALHWSICNNRENESNCDICANYLRRDWRGICGRHSTCREFAS